VVVGAAGAVNAVAVQSDGKTIAVGEDATGTNDRWAIRRYNTDGALDTGFGSGGTVLLFGDNDDDRASGVAIDANGNILVVGDVYRSLGGKGKKQRFARELAVVRLDTDGSLDTGFGSTGVAYASVSDGRAIAVQSDGKIVASGSTTASSSSGGGGGRGKKGGGATSSLAIALVRFDSAGDLDTGFGTDGVAVDDVSTDDDLAWAGALAVQSDGKLLVGGRRVGAGGGSIVEGWIVARYDSSGDLDTGFGSSGRVTGGPDGDESLTGLALQSDGKIVVCGWGSDGTGGFDAVCARYGSGGSLDSGFGSSGNAASGIADDEFGHAVAVSGDGKIVVAIGFEDSSYWDAAVLRFDSGGALDSGFGTGGVSDTTDADTRDRANAIAVGSSGIVIGGIAFDTGASDGLVARYCD
jgi:uncharacterized delta-60 repeat protein